MNQENPTLPVRQRGLGSRVGDFLFPEPAERRVGAIIGWWESRRLPYNLIVGASGVVSLSVLAISSALPPNPIPFAFSMVPVVIYGVLANLCYTLGSVVEVACHKLWGSELLPVGPSLFRAGLTLSVGLTLVVPVILAAVVWVLRLLGVFV